MMNLVYKMKSLTFNKHTIRPIKTNALDGSLRHVFLWFGKSQMYTKSSIFSIWYHIYDCVMFAYLVSDLRLRHVCIGGDGIQQCVA